MAIKPWIRLASRIVFECGFGKQLLLANFTDPRGNDQKFYLFNKPSFCVILPLTGDNKAITIRQYYQGSDKILRTLPGGNIDKNELAAETIRRELLEETGFQCSEIIQLGSKVWPDPRNISSFYYCFLGLGCEKIRDQNLDKTEHIEVELIPLSKWKGLSETEIEDSCAVVATNRALPYLQKRNLV